jgi:hypothetical protein
MSTGLRAGTNNDGYLQVNGTDVLTALSSGRIGIGTTGPARKVEIVDTAATVLQLNSTSSDGTSLRILHSGNDKMYMGLAGDFIIGQANNVTDSAIRSNGSLLFASGGGTERLRITDTGLVRLPDNGKLTLGAGDDLAIYHDGTDTWIDNSQGDLYIRNDGAAGDDIIIRAHDDVIIQAAQAEAAVVARGDGEVELYHDNSKKFETTSTGAKVTGALEVTQEYPTARPTLDLNFAATKTLDRRITFTRDSLGTYIDENGILKYASNNTPRFDHDPTTGESLGLLIEESRTNVLGLSSDLTDNNGNDWDNINGTISVNQTTAPDGTTTAASFTAAAGNAEHSVVFAELVPTGNVTVSVWVKTNTYSIVSFVLYGEANSTVSYNLSTKTVYNQLSNVSRATITEYPNGWYRIVATMNCTVANSRTFRLFASTGNFNAGGSESFYYWGPQLESGSFETSYIPTYASNTSVTRAQDSAKITGTNLTDFYNQSEGTIFADYKVIQSDPEIMYLSNNTVSKRIGLYEAGSSQTRFLIGDNGTQADTTDSTGTTVGDNIKSAGAYKLNDIVAAKNGVISSTDSSATIPDGIDRAYIGGYFEGTAEGVLGLRRLSYYNKRLPNAQLQGLTQQ